MAMTWAGALKGGASALVLAVAIPAPAPAMAQQASTAQAAEQSGPQAGPQSGPADPDNPDADKKDDQTDTVYIFGRATELIGTAEAASEGIVGEADFETRPLLRPGELAEVIPGMVAAQHSGGGKANQYYLRGFNLDHGTDFAGSFDGVPLNLRAHPHMNGYLDLNFLIPEVVETVKYYKGTGYAQNGDFSAATAADFISHDEAHENFVETAITDTKEYRLLAMGSTRVGETGAVLGALEWEAGDGPFDNPAGLKKFAGFLKYSTDWGNAKFHAELVGYDNDWHATDQMPLRAIQSGLIGRFGTLDPDLGGYTTRYIASAGLDWNKDTSVLAYAESYQFRLFNNPTFFLDQVNGDEFMQFTDRKALGARGRVGNTADLGPFAVDWRLGGDIRYDDISSDGLARTKARIPFQTLRNDSGSMTMADVWGEATIHWTDKLRTTLGWREDALWYEFDALQPQNSGSNNDDKFSPKLSAAYTFNDALEAYAEYGYAFHTNDPRGGVTHVDPDGNPIDPVDVFVESRGGEVGVRLQPDNNFNVELSVFELDLDSELIFSGDAGTSEPSGATQRYGAEINAFWRPVDWLAFDASGAWSHARFKDVPTDEDRIPNALEFVGSAGVTFTGIDGWEASSRIRYLGKSALIEDNSVRGNPSFLMNVGVSKNFEHFSIGLDVLNVTNSKDNEIEYYYESRLLGEPAPVADRMIHPLEPRTFRLVLRAKL